MRSVPQHYDVAIVGAGAAGLATAIFTRRANPLRRVALLDGAKKPGAKILVSGGSRCNVTNTIVSERDFWGGRAPIVRRVLRGFPVADTIAFFRELGVALHEEADGKLFPDSNRAREVLDALLAEAARVGADLLTSHRVTGIELLDSGFSVATSAGDLHADVVVLATGGQSLPKTGSDGAGFAIARRLGHTIVPPTPALAPLLLSDPDPIDGQSRGASPDCRIANPVRSLHRQLSGVSQDVEIAVWIDGALAVRLHGAMLWTHFGVSGPVALNASRHWTRAGLECRAVAVTVNFHPGQSFDEVDAWWTAEARQHPKAGVQSMLAARLPASLAVALLAHLGIDASTPLAHFARDDRRRLAHALVAWPLPVTGTRGYNYAEATAGGVALDEIDAATMASRVCRGLYLVGEILDVDGRIGGFNFQWAWSTGFVAGRALAARGAESGARPAD